MAKNRIIEDHNDWLLIDMTTNKYPSATCKIDRADYDLLDNKICPQKRGYPCVRINNKLTPLHRYIYPNYRMTDHINRDRTDNRRSNLREISPAGNSINQSIRSDNRTGITGVKYIDKLSKYFSYITVNGKQINLGYHSKINDAKKARYDAEKKYFKEYSPNIGATCV